MLRNRKIQMSQAEVGKQEASKEEFPLQDLFLQSTQSSSSSSPEASVLTMKRKLNTRLYNGAQYYKQHFASEVSSTRETDPSGAPLPYSVSKVMNDVRANNNKYQDVGVGVRRDVTGC